MRKLIALSLICLMLVTPFAAAQENSVPTVAVLRLGPSLSDTSLETAVMDTLLVYDWIDAEERALLNDRQDLAGEKLNIIWGDANYDLPTVSVMIEDALDRGADILLTISTPVTQIALNTTLNQDEPTPIIFSSVYSPYHAGVADAPCVKPAHVTGVEVAPPYDEAFEIFRLLLPANKSLWFALFVA